LLYYSLASFAVVQFLPIFYIATFDNYALSLHDALPISGDLGIEVVGEFLPHLMGHFRDGSAGSPIPEDGFVQRVQRGDQRKRGLGLGGYLRCRKSSDEAELRPLH